MGTIAGVVTDMDGKPVPDASIMVTAGPVHADLAALTDERGAYRLGGLDAGRYTLQVNAEGFRTASGRVPVRDRFVTRVDISLEREEVPEIDTEYEMPPFVDGRSPEPVVETGQRVPSRRGRSRTSGGGAPA